MVVIFVLFIMICLIQVEKSDFQEIFLVNVIQSIIEKMIRIYMVIFICAKSTVFGAQGLMMGPTQGEQNDP